MIGTCLLCDEHNMKLAKSHIIPKSLYGATLNDGLAKLHFGATGSLPKRSPVGVYDPNILCIKCESSLSIWDNYANELFVQTDPDFIKFDIDGKPTAEVYENFEQHKLQMFFISLIWRMQVTKKAMFKQVQLGVYERKFKAALIEEDPTLIPELDVLLFKFNSPLAAAFTGPTKSRNFDVDGYRVYFAHHTCLVKIDKYPFPSLVHRSPISNKGILHIMYQDFDGSHEKRMLMHIFKGD